jgi:hypothetical protein
MASSLINYYECSLRCLHYLRRKACLEIDTRNIDKASEWNVREIERRKLYIYRERERERERERDNFNYEHLQYSNSQWWFIIHV